MKTLYRVTQAAVALAHMVNAALYLGFGLLFIFIGVWVMFVFGLNWWAIGFGVFFILNGMPLVLRGGEIFLSTQPAERPDERQRYLRSRSLYVPEDRRDHDRRERGA